MTPKQRSEIYLKAAKMCHIEKCVGCYALEEVSDNGEAWGLTSSEIIILFPEFALFKPEIEPEAYGWFGNCDNSQLQNDRVVALLFCSAMTSTEK